MNYACTPLFLELGSEVAYPVGEGVVSGVMTFFWTLVGIIYLCMFFFKNIGYTWMNWTVMAGVLASIPFVFGIREKFNRTDIDNNNEVDFNRENMKWSAENSNEIVYSISINKYSKVALSVVQVDITLR